jgi:hypothetical protein
MKIPNSSVMGRVRDFLLKTIRLAPMPKNGLKLLIIYLQIALIAIGTCFGWNQYAISSFTQKHIHDYAQLGREILAQRSYFQDFFPGRTPGTIQFNTFSNNTVGLGKMANTLNETCKTLKITCFSLSAEHEITFLVDQHPSFFATKGTWAYLVYRQTQQNDTPPPAVFEYMEWNENLIYVKKVK